MCIRDRYHAEYMGHEASKNVSLFFGVRHLGVLLTAYTGGLLLESVDKRTIFKITALFPLILAFAAVTMPEAPFTKEQASARASARASQRRLSAPKADPEANNNKKSTMEKVWEFVRQPKIYQPIFFIFAFQMTPSAGSSMFFFYTNALGFPPEFMGQLKLAHSLANILGIFIYNRYLKQVPFKTIFTWSTCICVITGCTQILLVTRLNVVLGIPDKMFCLGDSLVINMFAELNLLPILVLACRMCPKSVEGTMYALLMSTVNFGSMLSYQLGAAVISMLGVTETNFDNLWMLIFFANICLLIPLMFLNKIEFEAAAQAAEEVPLEETRYSEKIANHDEAATLLSADNKNLLEDNETVEESDEGTKTIKY
eukprot:TRINITY_DN780_c0_g2_i2.p1 TRINITY_DN780_c0_g2~~TRINITY_DN780_c0_g2_i2.p1  ORF type:complete len:370 (-),score=103.85 TRINITY_DN780_c0_g2_i2:350-1459(-)